ncbi:MAG: TolC family protein [Bacteroidia bacterium]|nr:TolC family protein [Bacteroidia bacterium]
MTKYKHLLTKEGITKPKGILYVFIALMSLQTMAQVGSQPTSLHDLLKLAEANYPLLKSKALDVQAAQKGINISRSTLIPSLDASYQVNYGTYNNITGMAYPQFLIPISGPPSADNKFNGVFGSATSLLLNWQPITFGQRQAQVDYSKAGLQYTTSDAQNEIFQHKVKVINAYLDALTASELVKVYEKNYVRAETNLSVVKTLVVSGIKPGVDTALFKAEISRAKIDLLNSRKYKQQSIIMLSQLLAADNNITVTDSSYFSKLPFIIIATDSIKSPLLSLYNSSIELSKAKKKMLNRTMMPTLGVWGTTYARGSGIQYGGVVNSNEGLSFQRYNYGVGMQLSLPLLQFARIKPQLQQQEFLIKSNEEKLNDISLQLRKQLEIADTTLNNAFAVAKESPMLYESADFSYKALLSRYQSGLANYADLIQAQYILIKAETENKTTYIGVWKALLYKAAVTGDINLFINQVN